MKTLSKLCSILILPAIMASCNTDGNHSGNNGEGNTRSDSVHNADNQASGNRAVMEASNKDDYYQMRGYSDSIPSDSIKEAKRLDSIRIANSPNRNK